jgi:hypothetical protein
VDRHLANVRHFRVQLCFLSQHTVEVGAASISLLRFRFDSSGHPHQPLLLFLLLTLALLVRASEMR